MRTSVSSTPSLDSSPWPVRTSRSTVDSRDADEIRLDAGAVRTFVQILQSRWLKSRVLGI